MSIFKKGTCECPVTISSIVYVCNSCGHTEIAKSDVGSKKCPKCDSEMQMVSTSCEKEDDNNSPDIV
jgi:rubrerythrin